MQAQRAAQILKYLQDGYYIDRSTESLEVSLVTYNAELRVYAHTSVQVTFEKSGRLSMDFAIETVDLSIYDDSFDLQRFLLEIYFTALCLYELFGEVVEMRAYIKRVRTWNCSS